MDFTAIRSRLASSDGRLYWRSLGELADTPEFREYLHREFPEQASEWNDPKGRRDFLKLMSASLALAGVGACTKQPPENIVPYVRQPEEMIPGRPLFFASAISMSGVALPVLVESHMGRPTKIEGNPDPPNNKPLDFPANDPYRDPRGSSATDIFSQASILDLYDPDRSQTLTQMGDIRPFGAFVAAMHDMTGAQQPKKGGGKKDGAERSQGETPQGNWSLKQSRNAPASGPYSAFAGSSVAIDGGTSFIDEATSSALRSARRTFPPASLARFLSLQPRRISSANSSG